VDRRSRVLNSVILISSAASLCLDARAQEASRDMRRLTVLVTSAPKEDGPKDTRQRGTGVVIGDELHGTGVFVVTAAHVVRDEKSGAAREKISINLSPEIKADRSTLLCTVNAIDKLDDEDSDLALLRCEGPNRHIGFHFDVLGGDNELRRGSRMMVIGNAGGQPVTYANLQFVEPLAKQECASNIEFINPSLALPSQRRQKNPCLRASITDERAEWSYMKEVLASSDPARML
jgi:hypothetical protein